jgi:hypothetical protein
VRATRRSREDPRRAYRFYGRARLGTASAVDVCDRTTVSITNDAPAAFHAGVNVVTWTGTDGKGRIGAATQNVNDTTPPTVSCAAVSPQGHSFIVAADDICAEPVIRLSTYVLNDGEQIKRADRDRGNRTGWCDVDRSRRRPPPLPRRKETGGRHGHRFVGQYGQRRLPLSRETRNTASGGGGKQIGATETPFRLR